MSVRPGSGRQAPPCLRTVTKCPVLLAGIPTLIVLDPQGEVITRQGRVEVLNDEDCREFPWHPKPVLELSDSNAVQLNEGPCLVLFVGTELGVEKWEAGQNASPRRQTGPPKPLSFTVLSWGLCLPSSRVFDPNDLFTAIPLQAVVCGSYCCAFPLCCSCCQLGKQVRQEGAPSPP